MLKLRQIALVSAAFCLGKTALFAQSNMADDDFAKQVARLPWKTSDVTIGTSDSADPASSLIITAHYSNRRVVADTDIGSITFHPRQDFYDKNGVWIGGI